MDDIFQIHQACDPFCPFPNRYLPMASFGAIWLVPRAHQDARSGDSKRGKQQP